MDRGAWCAAVHGVAKSRTRLSDFTFTFHFPALEEEMATHSSVLAWRIPGMGEPGGLPSVGSHRVGDDWSDLAAAAAVYTAHRSVPGHMSTSQLQKSCAGGWKSEIKVPSMVRWRPSFRLQTCHWILPFLNRVSGGTPQRVQQMDLQAGMLNFNPVFFFFFYFPL